MSKRMDLLKKNGFPCSWTPLWADKKDLRRFWPMNTYKFDELRKKSKEEIPMTDEDIAKIAYAKVILELDDIRRSRSAFAKIELFDGIRVNGKDFYFEQEESQESIAKNIYIKRHGCCGDKLA